MDIYKKLNLTTETLFEDNRNLQNAIKALPEDEAERALKIAHELMPMSENIAELCGKVEALLPNKSWPLPTYYDMLFIR